MEYIAPSSLRGITRVLKKWKGRAALIAGGTNVVPDLRAKAIHPTVVIDLSHLKNLSYIKEEKKKIRIGALTTISDLATSKVIQEYAPVLYEASDRLGNPLVRNRATLAGNLADASPAADTAVPLLALEAFVVIERDGGKQREIPIDQFFVGPNQTHLKKDEIIKEVFFPKPNSYSKMGYLKLGLRNSMAISVVSLAVLMNMQQDKCKKVRIGLGAVAPTPMRAHRTEELLEGKEITGRLVNECCNEIAKEIRPISDIRASAEYRREMTSVLLRRLLWELTHNRGAHGAKSIV